MPITFLDDATDTKAAAPATTGKSKFTYLDAPPDTSNQPAVKPEGQLAAGARAFLSPLPRAIGSLLGGVGAGALAIESGPGALAAGLAGRTAGGALAEKGLSAVAGEDWMKSNEAQMAANAAEWPKTTTAASVVPTLVGLGGGSGLAKKAAEKVASEALAAGATQSAAKLAGEAAAKKLIPRALDSAAAMASMSGSEVAGKKLRGEDVSMGDFSDALAHGAAEGLGMGIMPHVDGLAKSIGAALPQAALMTYSGAAYDSIVHDKPFDIGELGKQSLANATQFAIFNAVAHGVNAARAKLGKPPVQVETKNVPPDVSSDIDQVDLTVPPPDNTTAIASALGQRVPRQPILSNVPDKRMPILGNVPDAVVPEHVAPIIEVSHAAERADAPEVAAVLQQIAADDIAETISPQQGEGAVVAPEAAAPSLSVSPVTGLPEGKETEPPSNIAPTDGQSGSGQPFSPEQTPPAPEPQTPQTNATPQGKIEQSDQSERANRDETRQEPEASRGNRLVESGEIPQVEPVSEPASSSAAPTPPAQEVPSPVAPDAGGAPENIKKDLNVSEGGGKGAGMETAQNDKTPMPGVLPGGDRPVPMAPTKEYQKALALLKDKIEPSLVDLQRVHSAVAEGKTPQEAVELAITEHKAHQAARDAVSSAIDSGEIEPGKDAQGLYDEVYNKAKATTEPPAPVEPEKGGGMETPFERIKRQAAEIGEIQAKLKKRAMIYAAGAKDDAASLIGINAERLYKLPYEKWVEIDKAVQAFRKEAQDAWTGSDKTLFSEIWKLYAEANPDKIAKVRDSVESILSPTTEPPAPVEPEKGGGGGQVKASTLKRGDEFSIGEDRYRVKVIRPKDGAVAAEFISGPAYEAATKIKKPAGSPPPTTTIPRNRNVTLESKKTKTPTTLSPAKASSSGGEVPSVATNPPGSSHPVAVAEAKKPESEGIASGNRDASKLEQMTPDEYAAGNFDVAKREFLKMRGEDEQRPSDKVREEYVAAKAEEDAARKQIEPYLTKDRKKIRDGQQENVKPFQEAVSLAQGKRQKLERELAKAEKQERELAIERRPESHRRDIESAAGSFRPVSASAVEAYGIKLPDGYTKKGDLYVYEKPPPPDEPGGSTPAPKEPTPGKPATKKPSPSHIAPGDPVSFKQEGKLLKGEFVGVNKDGTYAVKSGGKVEHVSARNLNDNNGGKVVEGTKYAVPKYENNSNAGTKRLVETDANSEQGERASPDIRQSESAISERDSAKAGETTSEGVKRGSEEPDGLLLPEPFRTDTKGARASLTNSMPHSEAQDHLDSIGVPRKKVRVVDKPDEFWQGRWNSDGSIDLNTAHIGSKRELMDILFNHENTHDALMSGPEGPKLAKALEGFTDALSEKELGEIHDALAGYREHGVSAEDMRQEHLVQMVRKLTENRPDLQTKWGRFVDSVTLAIKKFLGIKNLSRARAELLAAQILARGTRRVMRGEMNVEGGKGELYAVKPSPSADPEHEEAVARAEASYHKETAKDKVITAAKEVATGLRQIRSLLAPASVSPEAQLSAGFTRQRAAELEHRKQQGIAAMGKAIKMFNSWGKAESIAANDRVEKDKPQATPELDRIFGALKKAQDERVVAIQKLGKLEHVVENYFAHIWEKPEEAKSAYQKIFGKRPLEGSKAFLKRRTIPTTLEGMSWRVYDGNGELVNTYKDEASAKSAAAGIPDSHIGVPMRPVTYNPVELTLMKIHEMDRYIMGQRLLADLKGQKLLTAVPYGQRPPQGYTAINDSIARTNIRNPGTGKMEPAVWHAPADASRVLNNYLSPGLRGVKVFDAWRGIGNAMNMAQLGMSAFHAGMVSADSMISSGALGLEQLARGRFSEAAKSFAKIPVAPIYTMMKGHELMKQYKADQSVLTPEQRKMIDSFTAAGGRASMDSFYRTGAVGAFTKALKAGNYPGAVFRLPFAALEAVSHPLMEFAVPRMKLGIFYDMAREELARMPATATQPEVQKRMGKIWDSIDNRMGQLVYDNLFWHKALKDTMMASVRSVGWNLGTIRELGGGVKDMLTVKSRLKDGGDFLTHRMAYTIMMPVVAGIIGGIYQYLKTGETPQDLKDWYMPRTGATKPDGSAERVELPTYMKDVVSYRHHPGQTILNKLHPLANSITEMYANKDFYGNEIRDSDAEPVKQLQQEVEFIARQFVPFTVRNAGQRQPGSGIGAESFFGINPAPAELTRSDAQNKMVDFIVNHSPQGGRTPEEAARTQARKDLLGRMRQGEDVRKELKESPLSVRQQKQVIRDSRTNPVLTMFKHLSASEAADVLELADEKEKDVLTKPFIAKYAKLPLKDKKEIQAKAKGGTLEALQRIGAIR